MRSGYPYPDAKALCFWAGDESAVERMRLMKFLGRFQMAGLFTVITFVMAFGSQSFVDIPGYAAVYLDDASKTYIALPCIEDWRSRRGAGFAIARLSKASDAQAMHYKRDDDCRKAGGYSDEDRSLSGLLLVRLGILPPKEHWWNRPYRTAGDIVRAKR